MALTSAGLAMALDFYLATPFDNEPDARLAWANAYYDYWVGGAANGVPNDAPTTMRDAMESAMTGLSTTGPAAIQAGIVALWTAAVGSFAVVFPGSIAMTPPPGITGLAALLAPVFAANAVPGVTQTQALTNIATVIHTASLGGTATFPPAVVSPIL